MADHREIPQHLSEFTSKVPRRGPTPVHPTLGADERTRFLDHLLVVAERSTHSDDALLRRQAVYLLGFDTRPQAVDWLREDWKRVGRRTVQHSDIAGLLEARSASVALASAGDPTHLHDFADHMTDTRTETANLNYWAYWIGELNDEQTSDAFMLDGDTRSWVGARLLHHLMHRLEPESSHLPLNLRTLYALIASRPGLRSGRPADRASLALVLAKLASTNCLNVSGREWLAGL
jgi:hypothetical protein